jgi:murein DD-endopeptidase MepM/ murein hydrolase activator NlpD
VFLLVIACAVSSCKYSRQTVAPFELRGKWHTVEANDTISSVAAQYKTDPQELAELNDLYGENTLSRRKEIFIPTSDGSAPGTSTHGSSNVLHTAEAPRKNRTATPVMNEKPRCGRDNRPCFKWPVQGTLLAAFGSSSGGHHDGIDIAAAKGTSVQAAADGTVLYAGDEVKGYGNLIIIRHKGNIITVYAHNDRNLVTEGTEVKAGENIGTVGKTGNAAKSHLHFEVRVNEKPTDPRLYLPSLN